MLQNTATPPPQILDQLLFSWMTWYTINVIIFAHHHTHTHIPHNSIQTIPHMHTHKRDVLIHTNHNADHVQTIPCRQHSWLWKRTVGVKLYHSWTVRLVTVYSDWMAIQNTGYDEDNQLLVPSILKMSSAKLPSPPPSSTLLWSVSVSILPLFTSDSLANCMPLSTELFLLMLVGLWAILVWLPLSALAAGDGGLSVTPESDPCVLQLGLRWNTLSSARSSDGDGSLLEVSVDSSSWQLSNTASSVGRLCRVPRLSKAGTLSVLYLLRLDEE